MLRIWASKSAKAAKVYFTEGLVREDYYHEGREVAGMWSGLGAKRLGLEGAVDQPAFFALLDNTHPETGDNLTPRTKDGRRVGYDFSWSAPKSVSMVEALTGDTRIREAFQRCVAETMADLERETKTRVRLNGANDERVTGEMTYATFLHETSRPAPKANAPDPQLHIHAYVMNHTWDPVEERFKALDVARIKQDAPYYQAVFLFRLAAELRKLGYEITRHQTGWEITGISREIVRLFSNRTSQIEAYIEKKGLIYAEDKAKAAARTRAKKDEALDKAELLERWDERLSPAEREGIWTAYRHSLASGPLETEDYSVEAVDFAIAKCFERASAVTERRLLAEAIDFAAGRAITLEGIERELNRSNIVRREMDGRVWITTLEVIEEEQALLRLTRDGRGTLAPIKHEPHVFQDVALGEEQRNAVKHVLESQDRVVMIQGAPGVGKTRLTKEAVRAMEDAGKPVVAVAPTGESSRKALREGAAIQEADTLWQLLNRAEWQDKAKGGVIWVDEAGLIGTKSMRQLLEVAYRVDARVVLSGDPMQHTSVERGDALRLMAESAGAPVVRVNKIRRQQNPDYLEVAEHMSRGNVNKAWDKLEEMGAIVEAPDENRYAALAKEYVATLESGLKPLAVSPSHAEGALVTHEIREAMRDAGLLSQDEREFRQFKPLQVEEAEKYDARAYEPGTVVQFSQNVPGFKRGSRVEVEDRTPEGQVLVKGDDGPKELPLEKARHFELYNEHTVRLAPGDKVKITRNGKTKDGKHRPENSSIYTLKGFTDDGDLTLKENGWVLDKDFGHVSYGHCLTSMNAQSKDDDALFLAHSRHSLGAGSLNQALVSLTRGKKNVHVYTDDKDALLEQVKDRADRKSALELLGDSTPAEDPAQRALQFGLLINRLKAHERNAAIRRMATHVTPPRHQVPMGSYRAAWMRERGLGR